MVYKNTVFAVILFILILISSGCQGISNVDASNTTAPILTMIPKNTPLPEAIVLTPVALPEPTVTLSESTDTKQAIATTTHPYPTPTNTGSKPAVTKNEEGSLSTKANPSAAKSTPQQTETPEAANKAPVVTCDGDVCIIVTE